MLFRSHLSSKITSLKEAPKESEIKEYFSKIYTRASQEDLDILSKEFVNQYKKKTYLAEQFPNLKHEDIETLSNLIDENDIRKYEQDRGN